MCTSMNESCAWVSFSAFDLKTNHSPFLPGCLNSTRVAFGYLCLAVNVVKDVRSVVSPAIIAAYIFTLNVHKKTIAVVTKGSTGSEVVARSPSQN